MFESLRDNIRNLATGKIPESARSGAIDDMRRTLAQVKVGVADTKAAIGKTLAQLEAERAELATVLRRQSLAERINDAETVEVARRFAAKHAERVALLERKVQIQQDELSLVEPEVESMSRELREAVRLGGIRTPAGSAAEPDPLGDESAELQEELDSMARAHRRANKERTAEERLAALKEQMGK